MQARSWAIGIGLAVLVWLPAWKAGKTFWQEYHYFDRDRERPDLGPQRPPFALDVSWTSGGAELRGWFAPGSERAAVIALHGGGGNRTDVLPEIAILHAHGIGVLAFDLPGCGESGGKEEDGEAERRALRLAVDWLAARPEVDPARIGGFGFSFGGVPLLQVAAKDARIRGVAVAGTPGNVTEFASYFYRKYGSLTVWPALLGMRMRGDHLDDQVPRDVVAGIAPRPLLVIYGEQDANVPPWLTREIYDGARDPKELFVMPGVGHGEYATAPEARASFEAKIISFYTLALAPP